MRRWSRVVAAMLLLAALPAMPHFARDDFACDVGSALSGPHDESRHALRAAGDSGERDHCALCHWSRSLRSPLTPLGVTVAPDAPAAMEHGAVAAAPPAPALDHLPARAPPSALL